jgi:hypothetical protein
MPNGQPIATDLQVLEGFEEPFICDQGIPRDQRMAARWGCSLKQVYAIWHKPRFNRFIDYGMTLRSGWLTDAGWVRLHRLRATEPRS